MTKIIACDLDETLLVDNQISPTNLAAIDKLQQQGIKFIPCTGRGIYQMDDMLTQLASTKQGTEYCICLNGAIILALPSRQVVASKQLSYALVDKIYQATKHLKKCFIVYSATKCFIYHCYENERIRKIKQKTPIEIITTDDLTCLKDEVIGKVVFSDLDQDFDPIIACLDKQLTKQVELTYSSNRYLEINAKGVNKGNGLAMLANKLNIPINETQAIGDNSNDIPMLKQAGIGIAVANATKAAKDVAKETTSGT